MTVPTMRLPTQRGHAILANIAHLPKKGVTSLADIFPPQKREPDSIAEIVKEWGRCDIGNPRCGETYAQIDPQKVGHGG